MKCLIDTCVISELTKRSPDKNVASWISNQQEENLFLSVLTIGELEKGIAKLKNDRRQQRLREWVDHALKDRFHGRVLPFDYEVASRWGLISGQAEAAGKPMPVIDAMIAATALLHGLTLITRNTQDVAPSNVPIVNPWTL